MADFDFTQLKGRMAQAGKGGHVELSDLERNALITNAMDGGSVDPEEVQELIDESLEGYYNKFEVDSELNLKQNSSDIATINGSDITHGGNVVIEAIEGETITVDPVPTASSENPVQSGSVYTILNGLPSAITIPNTDKLLGYYSNAPTDGGVGPFTTSTVNYHIIFNVSGYRGCKVTTSSVTQYGLVKSYSAEVSITYCDGCNRETGTPTALTIPNDCNYLYLYIAASTNNISVTFTGVQEGVIDRIDNLESVVGNVEEDVASVESTLVTLQPAIDACNQFVTYYQFNKTNTKAVLTTPITLSQNGDSIEFFVEEIGDINTQTGEMYSFSYGSNSARIAIGIAASGIYVRASDGNTWIALNKKPADSIIVGRTIKIAYENGDINISANGTTFATYDGQPEFQLGCFGYNETYGYWEGKISHLKVNGQPYDISTHSAASTIITTTIGTFLSQSEQSALSSVLPSMMFQKTATKADIYIKTSSGKYIDYPLYYRYKAYESGQYPSFLDNWGIDKLKLTNFSNGQMQDVAQLFQSGEAELAIQVPSGADASVYSYTGGAAHGFENITSTDNVRDITMLVNGERIAEDGVVSLKEINKFEVIAHSLLYQSYTNTDPFAEVTKHWLFTADGVKITSSVKMLRSLNFGMAQFGMFCIYRRVDGESSSPYLANKVLKSDAPYTTYDISDGWWNNAHQFANKDHECKKMTLWGAYGVGASMEIETQDLKANGGMFIGTNGGQAYNKVYFDLTGSYTPTVGETLSATQIWYINQISE